MLFLRLLEFHLIFFWHYLLAFLQYTGLHIVDDVTNTDERKEFWSVTACSGCKDQNPLRK